MDWEKNLWQFVCEITEDIDKEKTWKLGENGENWSFIFSHQTMFKQSQWFVYGLLSKYNLQAMQVQFSGFYVFIDFLKRVTVLICLKLSSQLPKYVFICFNESPLKMMRYAFYFTLKAPFVPKIFKASSWLFGHVEKIVWLER